MRSRLQKYRKSHGSSKSIDISINSTDKDLGDATRQTPASQPGEPPYLPNAPSTPSPTTAITSSRSVNRLQNNHATLSSPTPSSHATPTMVQTIRTVPSFGDPSDTSSDAPSRTSPFSSSVNSNASRITMSSSHQERASDVRYSSQTSNGDATIRAMVSPMRQESEENPGAWDSTIGKAGLGKTGRVINKLVSDNDALKREIQLERLRADEAKREAKVAEERMERMIGEHESQLLEASVTKTLLARKERQVETLMWAVGHEKQRAAEALERESNWRAEMEKTRVATTRQVEEANTYAALMEGRYNAISSHWREQGEEVKRVHRKLRGEMDDLVAERRRDDEKISTLQELCDQQDGNIRELKRQRDEMEAKFEEYKRQQEEALSDIKTHAAEREAEQERMLQETRDVLNKLKWALNVKENVKDAG
ncbi:hypothetical protein SODALDRAFT_122598 [Sodiomyces alkalinus F11]|uniref:SWI5-dependent HO expression protein 3 n=1 Tax=Sodiomyces alkalinus (strain CBS 110278 / VKM F-3762 / F11) TaxID=1314773 RepID=A0A3N2Q483_SODAK|nr:hypothetical protein SODALDRAFT_122598 [Sodiomyces alkalinus F11]ROT41559.1 hypothetical protein SODALDRAFT_122598 [Sodiomyces alkalinus F11]